MATTFPQRLQGRPCGTGAACAPGFPIRLPQAGEGAIQQAVEVGDFSAYLSSEKYIFFHPELQNNRVS
jgi:hypothetical protein